MGIIDKLFNRAGYLRKSDIKPTEIIRVPDVKLSSYAPTSDKLLDIVQYYRSKYENYSFADLSKNTPIVRAVQNKITLDVTKKGFLLLPSFVKKCASCQEEFDTDVDVCTSCGGTSFIKPNTENKDTLLKLIESSNVNNTSLKKEIKSSLLDATRYDEGYLQKIYEYYIDEETKTLSKNFKYIQRVSPIQMFIIKSIVGVLGVDQGGNPIGFCPYHREHGIYNLNEKKTCPICKKEFGYDIPLYTADYYAEYGENIKNRIYYNREEIINYSFMEQSSRYSLISTLSDKITSLLAIDELINDVYVKRKVPNRALFFNSSDISGIQESDEYNANKLKEDKNFIPKYASGANNQGEFVKVIDMLGTIEELKLVELQDKYEKDVCQAYNAVINPSTRKIEIEPDFVEDIQSDINNYILKNIVDSLGIEDWELTLRPSETSNEANELRIEGLKLQNAIGRANLGFEITGYNRDTGEYTFSDKPTELPGQVNYSSFSSNSRGLEDTFGNLPGQEDTEK